MISRLLALQVFLYPLLFLSVGGVSAVKLIGVILLFLVVFNWTKSGLRARIPSVQNPARLLILFVAYTLVCQFIFGLFGVALYGELPASGGSEPIERFAVQLFASLQLYAFSYLLYEFAQRKPEIPSKAFQFAILLMIATGVYEVFSIYVGGPSIPLTLAGGDAIVNQNLSELLGARRLHGLAGEPRFFAALAVMLLNALIFAVIIRKTHDARSRRHRRVGMFLGVPILLVLIFQTQSSSGLIMLALMPLMTVLILKQSFATKIKLAVFTTLIALLFAPLLFDLFATRVIERIQEEVVSTQHLGSEMSAYVDVPIVGLIAMDATDATPMALLLDKPFLAITGLGVGNISTYVKPYLPNYGGYWGYGFTGIVEPNLGILKAILNYGLIGNFLLIFAFWKFSRHYKQFGFAYDQRMVFSYFLCMGSIFSTYLFTAPFISALSFLSFHAGLVTSFDRIKNGTAR